MWKYIFLFLKNEKSKNCYKKKKIKQTLNAYYNHIEETREQQKTQENNRNWKRTTAII